MAGLVELPEEFRTPKSSESEKEHKIFEGEQFFVVSLSQIVVDELEHDLLIRRDLN